MVYCACGRELETLRGLGMHANKCKKGGKATLAAIEDKETSKGGQRWQKLQKEWGKDEPDEKDKKDPPKKKKGKEKPGEAEEEDKKLANTVKKVLQDKTKKEIKETKKAKNVSDKTKAKKKGQKAETESETDESETETSSQEEDYEKGNPDTTDVDSETSEKRPQKKPRTEDSGLGSGEKERLRGLRVLRKFYGKMGSAKAPRQVVDFVNGKTTLLEAEEREQVELVWGKVEAARRAGFIESLNAGTKRGDGSIVPHSSHQTPDLFVLVENLSQAVVRGEIMAADRRRSGLSLVDPDKSERITVLRRFLMDGSGPQGSTPQGGVPRGGNRQGDKNCYSCGMPGHIAKNCPKGGAKLCFKCHRPGHKAADCKKKAKTVDPKVEEEESE